MTDDPNSNPPGPDQPDVSTLDPQPGETSEGYEAFIYFVDYGPKRSLLAVAKGMDISIDTIKKWSAAFKWFSRVKAHKQRFAQVRIASEAAALLQRSSDKVNQEARREIE